MEDIKKVCNVCKIEKSLDNYSAKKRGLHGKASRCKSCDKEYHLKHRAENYEAYRAKEKAYKESNREIIRARSREEYKNTPIEIHREKAREKRAKYGAKLKASKKEYRSRPEIKTRDREYNKNRYKNNIQYKLSCRLRIRISNFLKAKNNTKKIGSAVRDLGCSIDEFKAYLESKFEPWMTWENYGAWDLKKRTWQIDHIIPLCKFSLEKKEDFLKACHYTNLQPLCSHANYKKNRF